MKVLKHRLSLNHVLRKLYRAYRDWDRLIDMLPRDLAEILRRVRNGTFQVKLEHHKLESTVNRLVLGILSASFFIGSSVMLSHQVEPAPGGISIIGSIGCFLSLVFAWRLGRAIRKADDSDKKK